MFEEITQLVGKEDGSTSIILAGVHGDEQCGVEALRKILPSLEIEKGRVLFGYGNPRAIEANKRYTEANLNRLFKTDNLFSKNEKESYEYGRAQFLKTYLGKAEALLDIHASSIPNSRAFAICEPNAKGIVEYLPVDLVVSGFDQVEPGGTDYYMNSIGKIGICVECGYLCNSESIKIAEESVFAFLKARGHMRNNLVPQKQAYVQMFKKYFAKTDKFTLLKPFENFETLEENQLIGIDGQEEVKTSKRSLILFAHNGTRVGAEVFLSGEKRDSLA
ncbi:MAG: succinylglutamate desuccinylase [Parcubacteria group bacterium Gr01-1014_49]|nr:MAG: succinylglutamate desuccinylase [Parcubacteria group bacterium Gr01-1014_49]